MVTKKIYVDGMTCESCEKLVKKTVKKLDGVKSIDIDYATQTGTLDFDPKKISFTKVKKALDEKNYTLDLFDSKKHEKKGLNFKYISIGLGITLILYVLYTYVFSGMNIEVPQVGEKTSFALLFLLGVLTSFHCVGMCGGFIVSFNAKKSTRKEIITNNLKYGGAKTLSYTIIGTLFGLIGSIFAFTPMMRGITGIIAGLFLVLYGLNMLNVSSYLRKIKIHLFKSLDRFTVKTTRKSKSPIVIGLLNGLMIACGPLQAMYIFAAGLGSPLAGGFALMAFGLGTLPVLFGFGFLTSIISAGSTKKILKASGVIVIILGLIMVNRGLSLTGSGYDFKTITSGFGVNNAIESNSNSYELEMDGKYQVIEMNVTRYGWSPDKFVIQKDIPVMWKIYGLELNGCNNEITIPSMDISKKLKSGLNEITFTPTKEGNLPFSCWMGMIPGVFIVKDDVKSVNVEKEVEAVPITSGGSCGSTSGSCGCGGR